MAATLLRADVDPQALPQVSYHPGGAAYWDRPYFANAMTSGSWVDQNFQTLPYWSSAQFDANGFPQTLLAGQTEIRAIVNGLHAGYGASPSNFPDLRAIFRGHWVRDLAGQRRHPAGRDAPSRTCRASRPGPRRGRS